MDPSAKGLLAIMARCRLRPSARTRRAAERAYRPDSRGGSSLQPGPKPQLRGRDGRASRRAGSITRRFNRPGSRLLRMLAKDAHVRFATHGVRTRSVSNHSVNQFFTKSAQSLACLPLKTPHHYPMPWGRTQIRPSFFAVFDSLPNQFCPLVFVLLRRPHHTSARRR
jgi:hypothetical protein